MFIYLPSARFVIAHVTKKAIKLNFSRILSSFCQNRDYRWWEQLNSSIILESVSFNKRIANSTIVSFFYIGSISVCNNMQCILKSLQYVSLNSFSEHIYLVFKTFFWNWCELLSILNKYNQYFCESFGLLSFYEFIKTTLKLRK